MRSQAGGRQGNRDDAKLEPDGRARNIDRKVQAYLAILDLMPGRRECEFCLNPVRDLTSSMFPFCQRRTIKAPACLPAMAGALSRILQSWFRTNLCLCQSV